MRLGFPLGFSLQATSPLGPEHVLNPSQDCTSPFSEDTGIWLSCHRPLTKAPSSDSGAWALDWQSCVCTSAHLSTTCVTWAQFLGLPEPHSLFLKMETAHSDIQKVLNNISGTKYQCLQSAYSYWVPDTEQPPHCIRQPGIQTPWEAATVTTTLCMNSEWPWLHFDYCPMPTWHLLPPKTSSLLWGKSLLPPILAALVILQFF